MVNSDDDIFVVISNLCACRPMYYFFLENINFISYMDLRGQFHILFVRRNLALDKLIPVFFQIIFNEILQPIICVQVACTGTMLAYNKTGLK